MQGAYTKCQNILRILLNGLGEGGENDCYFL
jgi:hypothetical protein